MKKSTIFAYVCIFALVGAGLSSCKKDEPKGQSYNGEQVKTQFAISLPKQLSGKRHMPSTTVQRDGASQFQGISSIILIPFDKPSTILSTDSRLGGNIHLAEDVSASDIANAASAKVYNDVSIPLSTASFLFYGRSAATGTKFAVGSLLADTASSITTPADISFALEQIQEDASALTATTAEGGKLLQYLTNVAIATDGAKAWYAYTDADNAAIKAMFDTYATIRGLSSFEVARVLQDLYRSLKPLSSDIATGIKAAINDATYIKTDVLAANDSVALIAALESFPQSYDLPEGAIDIAWDATTHKFIVGSYSGMATPDRYVYPAQLWYYTNSTVKTSNTSKQTMYDTATDWDEVLDAHTDAISVNTRTRAVAIENPIQYAVARLDVQVRLKQTSMEDNSATVEGARTDVDCTAGFPVTAILVGGQQAVNFDFTANTLATEYTIYDKVMASTQEATPADMIALPGTTPSAYSALNHTLVLENGTGDVNVAIEMVNTSGVDFYGAGGQLIPKDGKFYVVAQLEAASATETSGHVFKQDFTTTAKLTLKDLKSAYNTIPDLRTPQLELGFSVDLTWQSGHTYEVEF